MPQPRWTMSGLPPDPVQALKLSPAQRRGELLADGEKPFGTGFQAVAAIQAGERLPGARRCVGSCHERPHVRGEGWACRVGAREIGQAPRCAGDVAGERASEPGAPAPMGGPRQEAAVEQEKRRPRLGLDCGISQVSDLDGVPQQCSPGVDEQGVCSHRARRGRPVQPPIADDGSDPGHVTVAEDPQPPQQVEERLATRQEARKCVGIREGVLPEHDGSG